MNDWSRADAWYRYRRRQERAWTDYDPRLLWRPCDEIATVLKRISHRRPVRYGEAEKIASKMARRLASGPGAESVKRAVLGRWHRHDEFLWKGRVRGCRCWMRPWEELEREARAEGRQFCLIAQHRSDVLVRLYRRERALDELRRLTNKLEKTITARRKVMKERA